MTGKITSLKVATRAGASWSAANRVFTPGASVSVRTAGKKRDGAALGYRPNMPGRSLMMGRSLIIEWMGW